MAATTTPKFRNAVDAAASLLLVLLLAYLILKQPSNELPEEALTALLMFYLGLLFGCAYVSPTRLHLLRALVYFVEHFTYPPRRAMILVYSVVFFGIAAFNMIGVLNSG